MRLLVRNVGRRGFPSNKVQRRPDQQLSFVIYHLLFRYGPYETDGTITFPEKYELVNQLYYVQTKLFEQHRITYEMVVNTLQNSNIVFRAFSNRLFEVTHDAEMPLYIISGELVMSFTPASMIC